MYEISSKSFQTCPFLPIAPHDKMFLSIHNFLHMCEWVLITTQDYIIYWRLVCLQHSIQRILHSFSLHFIYMKRVYYYMTHALASVIFIIVNKFHKNNYVMSRNLSFFLSHNTFKSFKIHFSSSSTLYIPAKM